MAETNSIVNQLFSNKTKKKLSKKISEIYWHLSTWTNFYNKGTLANFRIVASSEEGVWETRWNWGFNCDIVLFFKEVSKQILWDDSIY